MSICASCGCNDHAFFREGLRGGKDCAANAAEIELLREYGEETMARLADSHGKNGFLEAEIRTLRARLERALDHIDHLYRNDPMPEDIAKLRGEG